jgi:hypothetical protein
MRYKRAVEKLRILAETCERVKMFWFGSVDDGPDERALSALEARDFGSLERLIPEPADERLQLRGDLGVALSHLREVRDKYRDHG